MAWGRRKKDELDVIKTQEIPLLGIKTLTNDSDYVQLQKTYDLWNERNPKQHNYRGLREAFIEKRLRVLTHKAPGKKPAFLAFYDGEEA
ncbi:MAG: hypothetical protein GOV15_00985, partial [Candidatus Diapherotrites archaeon]|nr:hypothetical protein [Candidatus Diapherotrites archaeon]